LILEPLPNSNRITLSIILILSLPISISISAPFALSYRFLHLRCNILVYQCHPLQSQSETHCNESISIVRQSTNGRLNCTWHGMAWHGVCNSWMKCADDRRCENRRQDNVIDQSTSYGELSAVSCVCSVRQRATASASTSTSASSARVSCHCLVEQLGCLALLRSRVVHNWLMHDASSNGKQSQSQ